MKLNFSQPQVLECPSCGASLSIPDSDSFTCAYCGKHILVPPEYHKRIKKQINKTEIEHPVVDAQPIISETQAEGNARKQGNIRLIIGIFTVISIFISVGIVAVLLLTSKSQSSSNEPGSNQLRTTPLPTLVQFARLALVFGTKGDQPGQFDDARSIAVDSQGDIFVADYTTGRINKFDAQGNFRQLIQVRPANSNEDILIFGIATDNQQNLYVAANGNILKYNSSTGELLLTIPEQFPDIYYNSVIVAPDGDLYATNGMASGEDEVFVLNPQGKLLEHWTGMITSVNHDDPVMEEALAVSHSGLIYLISPMADQIYGFNPDGTYNFSFGQLGDATGGQAHLSIGLLAITRQDYLVISDVYQVYLYTADGSNLGKSFTIDYKVAQGSSFGMTIDSQGDLYYISSGGKVLKFSMNYP